MADSITKKIDGQALISHFSNITDVRVQGRVLYPLVEIIILSFCAILSDAKDWGQIAIFCKENIKWFSTFLELEHGIPSEITFCRAFSKVCPNEFLNAYSTWALSEIKAIDGSHIAIDGKTNRGSHNYEKSIKAMHLINAYSVTEKLLIDSEKTPDKSNEIKGIPILLKRMEVAGALISIDAMGTQKGIANLIKLKKADYCLALKANQKGLYKRVKKVFERAEELDFNGMVFRKKKTSDCEHGRYEVREYTVLPLMYLPKEKHTWKGIQTFIQIKRTRYIGDEIQESVHYYISSLALKNYDRIIHGIRNHWLVENALHYKLDVAFKEDDSKVFLPNSVINLSTLRKLALACIEKVIQHMSAPKVLWKNAINVSNVEQMITF